jgi:hypothetical protein
LDSRDLALKDTSEEVFKAKPEAANFGDEALSAKSTSTTEKSESSKISENRGTSNPYEFSR